MASTVDRVLPWRRTAPPAEELAPLLADFRRRQGRTADVDVIIRAFTRAKAAHDGQHRRSGEPYIHHPLAVARIVAEQGLDATTIVAALLHDAVEDTAVTVEEVAEEFGPDVAAIVDGVTKLERIHFDTKEQQQAATVRKMLVAMAKDLRVLIIKLADRLHNMRTIGGMPGPKQERIARETLDIYAPLAHRLGMQDVRQQLEDLSFAALHPKRFAEIEHMVSTRTPERDLYLHQVVDQVHERLAELRITADVTGRPKHLWSIYEKMVVRGKDFEGIFDLVAIRVIVESVKDCYAALGSIHSAWKPVPGRFKDYIAMPKFNLYQSLHTTVVGPQGKPLEVQIRTTEMHARAERGVAAHWQYKAKQRANGADDMQWLNRIVDWQEESTDPDEFMKNLKIDLEQDEVYAFTPKGRVITMPSGATPIDFAYAVHTEVGHATIGAKVNGRLVPLDSTLVSGDTVEVVTSKVDGAGPSRDWLNIVVSPRARNKIRQWFSRERREDAIETGQEELLGAMRRQKLPLRSERVTQILKSIAEAANYTDVDALYAAIGEHHVSAKSIAHRIEKELSEGDDGEERVATNLVHDRPRRTRTRKSKTGVHVEGLDDVMVRLSRCCTPVPGDEIVGFITRGRGVSVHRADCANAVSLGAGQRDRLIDVDWDGDTEGHYTAAIEVKALDRSRLLFDVSKVLSEHHVNIIASHSRTNSDRVSILQFEFELGDPVHLESALASIKAIDSVYDAYRVVPGKGG